MRLPKSFLANILVPHLRIFRDVIRQKGSAFFRIQINYFYSE